MDDLPPGAPGSPKDPTERLLGEVVENTRRTREYVGWLTIIAAVQLMFLAAWLLGVITIKFEPISP